jgi:hypothetical protein
MIVFGVFVVSFLVPCFGFFSPLRYFHIHNQRNDLVASSKTRNEKLHSHPPVDDVLEMLNQYKAIHGNLLIPRNFVIPNEAPWPADFQQFKLGRKVSELRSQLKKNNESEIFQNFDKVGFIWNAKEFKLIRILRAAVTYKKVYHSTDVSPNFVVPTGDGEWDRDLWGFAFGKTLKNIAETGSYQRLQPYLQKIGFSVTPHNHQLQVTHDDIQSSLQTYYAQYGSYNISPFFVIAKNNTAYPASMRGKRLFLILEDLYKPFYAEIAAHGMTPNITLSPSLQALHRMGYHHILRPFRNDDLVDALTVYREHMDPHLHIPKTYLIPANDIRFSPACRGLPLGRVYHDIQQNISYSSIRERLTKKGLLKIN